MPKDMETDNVLKRHVVGVGAVVFTAGFHHFGCPFPRGYMVGDPLSLMVHEATSQDRKRIEMDEDWGSRHLW